jgi:hypothetical protein
MKDKIKKNIGKNFDIWFIEFKDFAFFMTNYYLMEVI